MAEIPAPAGQVREALRLIVADPQLGLDALGDPALMTSVLSDFLPDAPAEASVIRAAMSAGVPSMLAGRSDMPVATSIRLAAVSMSQLTGYPVDTAEWAARELAIALGLAPAEPTELAGTVTAGAEPVPVPSPPPPSRPKRRWVLPTVIGGLISLALIAFAAIAIHPWQHPRTTARRGPESTASGSPTMVAVVACSLSACPTGRQNDPCTVSGQRGIIVVDTPGHLICDANGPVTPTPAPSPATLADFKVCIYPATECTSLYQGHFMRTEPSRIITSADGSGFVESLTWTGWGTPTARGAGVLEIDNCTPNCASGTYSGYRATVTLTDPVAYGSGKYAYGRIVVSTPGSPYTPTPFTAGLVP